MCFRQVVCGRETPSGGNLAFADHLHAQKPIYYKWQERENPKIHNGAPLILPWLENKDFSQLQCKKGLICTERHFAHYVNISRGHCRFHIFNLRTLIPV